MTSLDLWHLLATIGHRNVNRLPGGNLTGIALSIPERPSVPPLFTLLPPGQTQVNFANTLTEGLNTNVMAYEYFYNGGGVAVGDVNNDGWEDLYFSGNMISNRLYLNQDKNIFSFRM